ncbi:phosphotransferase family protein [Halalkalicoccus ordinarius]|uniref:phosphotransferase family protein n=1 Tax=Halalkalicoccus ordinarius TaxID=3116651 RepID=UPI00300EF432
MSDETYLDRLVNEEALRSYLEEALGSTDEFSIQRHAEGHSNETLFLTWGERELVLRRPPPGETADTAHDVLREYRVMDALQDTEVPMPTTVLACEDHDVLGSDFYLMERLPGDVIRGEEPERFADPDHRERIGEELVDTLAAIHGVDHEAVGLDGFGRPAGFTERQVERWGKQIDWAAETTAERREVPELDRVGEWLEANVPDDYPHTLVHGDYKLDNVSFAPGTPPEIGGVLDWELSTLGDPFTDLGWMLSFWHDADDPEPAIPELYPTFMAHEDYSTREELVARYEDATGYEFEHDRFYRALAVYKMAGLGEMFLARYMNGDSDDDLYPQMEEAVPRLAERALEIIEDED